jgi:cyclopropane fatty-acyl-phospholipid synthase-like methyltransferase
MASHDKITLFERAYWRLMRLLGFKRLAWDNQFQKGIWSRGSGNQHTINLVTDLCKGGRLVEFGCGEGPLPRALSANVFSDYIGYDVSQVAVDKATRLACEAGLQNVRFQQCDMSKWKGDSLVSLVLTEESLYYLSASDTEKFLRICRESLVPDGRILVIVHCADKHSKTLAICRKNCRVIDESLIEGCTYLTMAAS